MLKRIQGVLISCMMRQNHTGKALIVEGKASHKRQSKRRKRVRETVRQQPVRLSAPHAPRCHSTTR